MSLSKPTLHLPAGLGKSVYADYASQSETRCAQDVLCPEITAAQHEKVIFYV